ncbi:PA2779 family protein [Halopseudomonas nanhaiensis]|uniref:PA2779 family protein n=1 Tax=Halopseudomonas nanhaiensis TaxID=2830842 RepID=UPI003C2BBA48|nr:PA2779 family protein [Halopseudomonas nanhaiensis]
MTLTRTARRYLSAFMTALFMLTSMASLQAQAAMIGTHEVVAEQQLSMDRQALKDLLADQDVQNKMTDMGVSAADVEQRIDSLTAEELAQFNSQLEDGAAGGSVVGVIVLFLLIFVVTDILCLTDIYSVVNCSR